MLLKLDLEYFRSILISQNYLHYIHSNVYIFIVFFMEYLSIHNKDINNLPQFCRNKIGLILNNDCIILEILSTKSRLRNSL